MEEQILFATDKIKNSGNNPSELLTEFAELYKIAKERNEKYCSKCEEWRKMKLPINCLAKPDYCIRNINYSIFIIWYEDLR